MTDTRFTDLPEGTTARCQHCGSRILLDLREGGGPAQDWGASPEDWTGNGGIGMDYGCDGSPDTDEDASGGHDPIPRSIRPPGAPATAPDVTFFRKVDKRSRSAMMEFLSGHFRYDTMNSWNKVTSYANNVKVTRVLPSSLHMKAFEVLEAEGAIDEINSLLHAWDHEHQYAWQVGFNGRSSGYLVLYQGGRKPSEYKRICRDCGQKNYRADSVKCGRCHSDRMVDYSGFETFSLPGRGVDDDTDFTEWTMSELRDRVALVQEFDQLCDNVVAAFIAICEDYEVAEETVMIPRRVKVLR